MEETKGFHLRRVMRVLREQMRPQRKRVIAVVLLAALTSGLFVVQPILYGRMIDELAQLLAGSQVQPLLWQLLFVWAIVLAVSSICFAVFHYLIYRVCAYASTEFMNQSYASLLSKDLRTYEKERAGKIWRKIDQSWDAVFWLVHSLLRHFVISFFDFTIILPVAFWIDWRMACVLVGITPLFLLVNLVMVRYARPLQDALNDRYLDASGLVGDALMNVVTIKSFVLERKQLSSFVKRMRAILGMQGKIDGLWALGETLNTVAYTGAQLAIIGAGAYFIVNGWSTIGSILTFIGFANHMLGSLQVITQDIPQITKHASQVQQMTDLMDIVPQIDDMPGAKKLMRIESPIVFRNIEFTYPDGKKVLNGITLEIPKEKMTALVGYSGAGKSTIVKLLMRFYDPTAGSIEINGKDIRSYTLDSLRDKVGYVMQESMLFNTTILDNIRIAKPRATRAQVEAAAKKAQAHEFIKRLPEGYNTAVGDRGMRLSGGEKQRIALARVFLNNPPILVLDEATSALDSRTEHELQKALFEVVKGRTTLIIAHRLSTIMAADQIVVLEHGAVVEAGTHRQLIAKDTLYRDFWHIQAGGYGDYPA